MVLRERVVAEAAAGPVQEQEQSRVVRVRQDRRFGQSQGGFLSVRLGRTFLPRLMFLTGACLLAGTASAQQDQAAGRFLSVTGDVRVVGQNGATRPAQRTAEIREGESIVTGANGLGQVRMADGTL